MSSGREAEAAPLRLRADDESGGWDYIEGMTKDEIAAILDRVPNWPLERQQELAELALEIEAEANGEPYSASAEELQAIDEARASGIASHQEVEAAFARLRKV